MAKERFDLSSMFAPAAPASEPAVPAPAAPVAPAPVEQPPVEPAAKEENIQPATKPAAPKKKTGSKSEAKTTQRGEKTITTLSISTDVLEDYQYLMKILDKPVSNAVEDFMRSELKKNAEFLTAVKNLRKPN